MNFYLSPHLTTAELACKDGARTPVPADLLPNARRFALEVFEPIRALWGRPIVVLSGYRTPDHNRLVGGAPGSLHLQALAGDLRPPAGVSVEEFWARIVELSRTHEGRRIRGIGFAPPSQGGYVHADCRDSDLLAQWTYPLTTTARSEVHA